MAMASRIWVVLVLVWCACSSSAEVDIHQPDIEQGYLESRQLTGNDGLFSSMIPWSVYLGLSLTFPAAILVCVACWNRAHPDKALPASSPQNVEEPKIEDVVSSAVTQKEAASLKQSRLDLKAPERESALASPDQVEKDLRGAACMDDKIAPDCKTSQDCKIAPEVNAAQTTSIRRNSCMGWASMV